MTTHKRSWKDWAVDFLKQTGRCIGEVPSTGLPGELMTEDEFKMTVSYTHPAKGCSHFMNERLGMPLPETMHEIRGIDASPVTEEDVARGKETFLKDGKPLGVVDRFKRELHTYVDLIEIKDGGRLSVPSQLMKFESFLRQFFDVKG